MTPPIAHVAGMPLEEAVPALVPAACAFALIARAALYQAGRWLRRGRSRARALHCHGAHQELDRTELDRGADRVLADLIGGYVDRHPGLLADGTRDGRADLVGFGDDGMRNALRTRRVASTSPRASR